LQAGAADGNDGILFKNSAGTQKGVILFDTDNDYMLFSTNDTERMRIDSSGRLLLGLSSSIGADALLQVQGSGNRKAHFHQPDTGSCVTQFTNSVTGTNTGDGFLVGLDSTEDGMLWLYENKNITFATNNSEQMRITSGGNTLFNCSSFPSSSVSGFGITGTSSGNASSSGSSTSAYNHFLFYNGNGIVGFISSSGSNTTYSTSSDYRLKENVTQIADGITRVKQLQPKRFNFIADDTITVDGFIAHEAQTVVPEAVTGTHNEVDDDGNAVMQGIDQSKLVPLLTAALQEAIAKIETLEQRLSDAGIA